MRVGKAESTAGEAIRAASSSDSEESDMMHEEKDFLEPRLVIIEEESIENPNPSNLDPSEKFLEISGDVGK